MSFLSQRINLNVKSEDADEKLRQILAKTKNKQPSPTTLASDEQNFYLDLLPPSQLISTQHSDDPADTSMTTSELNSPLDYQLTKENNENSPPQNSMPVNTILDSSKVNEEEKSITPGRKTPSPIPTVSPPESAPNKGFTGTSLSSQELAKSSSMEIQVGLNYRL